MEQKTLQSEEIKVLLQRKQQAIQEHITALESELVHWQEELKERIQTWVEEHPAIAAGGAMAVGLMVGLFWRRRRRKKTESHEALAHMIAAYVDALARSLTEAIERGIPPEEAVQEVMRKQPPLLVYMVNLGGARSLFREITGMVLPLMVQQWVQPLIEAGLARLTASSEKDVNQDEV